MFRSKMGANGLWYAWACPGPYNGDSCTKAEGAYEFHNPPTNEDKGFK